MFEVGFSELLMVGLVALLVIGPKELPRAARVLGFWLGKARGMVAHVQSEIQQELHAEEMRQLAEHYPLTDELQKAFDDSQAAVKDIDSALEALATPKTIGQHDEPSA